MNFTEQIPQNSTFGKILLVCGFTAILGVSTIVSSCKSAEKKQAKLYGKFDKLKRKADADSVLKVVPSKWSLDNFPLTISKGKTVYIPSKPKIIHDTTTTTKTVNDTVYVTKYVTKHHYQTDTLITTDTIIDNRPQALCNAEIKRLQTELSNQQVLTQKAINKAEIAQKRLNKRTGVMWWLIAVVLLLTLWTFRKLIPIFK